MKDSVHIILDMFFAIKDTESVGVIASISISPRSICERAEFGIAGKEKQYSLDELRDELKKYRFKKGDRLLLFVVNVETGKKQEFGLNFSNGWPDGFAGDIVIKKRASYEITPFLESVCLICS